MKKDSGFAILELILVVAIVAAVVVVGYYVWHGDQIQNNEPAPSSSMATVVGVPTAPKINSKTSLNMALNDLDSTSVSANSNYSSQLSQQAASL